MASIREISKGKFKVEIVFKGKRSSKTFASKMQARAWASAEHARLQQVVEDGQDNEITFKAVAFRYLEEVTANKKSVLSESKCINGLMSHDAFHNKRLVEITPEVIEKYKKQRLREIKAGSVRRYMTTLSSILSKAVDWDYISKSPMAQVTKPEDSKSRKRIISDGELAKLLEVMGFDYQPAKTIKDRLAIALLFSLESGARASELCAITKASIEGKNAILPTSKNGEVRYIPISSKGFELLKLLPEDGETVFNLTESQIDSHWRKYKKLAGITDLHWHDLRHSCATRWVQERKVIDAYSLSRLLGHKDTKQSLEYFNPSHDDLAGLLQ